MALLERIHGLQEDDQYGAVIVDPGTDVMKLIKHHILAPYGVGSSGDLNNRHGYFAQMADKGEEFVQELTLLASEGGSVRPKIVIVPFHVQPIKEGDEQAQDVEFQGKVLPKVEGSYRRTILADADMAIYCHLKTERSYKTSPPKDTTEYLIQVVPNEERHAKIRLAPRLDQQYLPNDYSELVEALEK